MANDRCPLCGDDLEIDAGDMGTDVQYWTVNCLNPKCDLSYTQEYISDPGTGFPWEALLEDFGISEQ